MKRLLFCVVVLVLLTACGGGSSDPNTNPDPNNPPGGTTTFEKLGFVTLSESSFDGGVSRIGSGVFLEPAEATPVSTNDQFIPLDTCIVIVSSSGTDPEPTPDPDEPKYLDAGEALTLISGDTTYATLVKSPLPPGGTPLPIIYSSASETLPEFPASLTLNIPGATDGFPAFSNVAMPTIPPDFELTLSGSEGIKITKDTTFAWTGQGSGDTVFGIIAYDFSRVSETSSQTLALICYARDDGSFALPDTTKAELDVAGFTNIELSTAFRQSNLTQTNGDAALILSVQRAKSSF
jgi:hypothetical protein